MTYLLDRHFAGPARVGMGIQSALKARGLLITVLKFKVSKGYVWHILSSLIQLCDLHPDPGFLSPNARLMPQGPSVFLFVF